MLSEAEKEFLRNPQAYNANYSKALRHRIRGKIEGLREDLRLLECAGFAVTGNFMVTEKCNPVTEFSNPVTESNNRNLSLNQVAFREKGINMVRSPGFEPGIVSLEG